MTDTREQIIEQMARAEWSIVWPNSDPALASREFIRTTAAALPIAVRAVTARVRELHYAAYCDADRTPICSDCHGKAGTHPCGCWRDDDVVPVCGVCYEGWKYIPVPYPCPTVRLLDQIDAELGGEHP